MFDFLMNQKPFDGSEFLVYTTEVCPKNLTEWQERSFALNCTRENAYMCLPNANITELLEFCYSQPQIQITKGNVNKLKRNSFYNMLYSSIKVIILLPLEV